MPQKPEKFGTKFWMVCDTTTSFVLRAFPYVGREEREVGFGEHVTLSLMEPYKNTGVNVTTDNFFISLSLARRHLQSNITMLGTMRAHRREILPETKLGKGATLYSSTFLFTPPEENIMLLSYKAKKNKVVYLLFSSHKTTTVNYGKQKKPQAILDYNATKEGVDTADEMLCTYSTKAASQRWPLTAFFNLVDITTLDTYIICADISISTCSRRDFLIKLGESLCSAEEVGGRKRYVCYV